MAENYPTGPPRAMRSFLLCKARFGFKLKRMSRISVVLVALGVLILFVLGLVFGLLLPRLVKTAGAPAILNTTAVVQQVQTLSQLVTVKYVIEKIVVLEDAKWYGENRVTLVAHGVAKAGVNLDRLGPGDVEIDGPRITLALPPVSLTDVYLDDHHTQVLERATGLLRTFDKNLEQEARRQAVDQIRVAALENGIAKEAGDRARDQLSNLFHQLGFAEVVFRDGRGKKATPVPPPGG
jgi:hypothetical protein